MYNTIGAKPYDYDFPFLLTVEEIGLDTFHTLLAAGKAY
jgi:hypothetical protein